MGDDTGARQLVSSAEAARRLTIDRSTLSRWAAAGIVTPAYRTAGGHMRWDVDDLRQQLARQGLGPISRTDS